MSVFQDIKDAFRTMLEDNEYIVNDRKSISRPSVEMYVTIENDGEDNRDINNYVGSCQYRNRRIVTLYVHRKTPVGVTDIDRIYEQLKEEYEVVLDDFKRIFNSPYNIIGDAGAFLVKYEQMRFEETKREGKYTPLKMRVSYLVEYVESRKFNNNDIIT